MDKLDEAFLYSEAIDVPTYGRQRDKLREELPLALQNAFCCAPQTCGARRRSITSSGCSGCSFLKESLTTEIDSIEPPQRHHFSTTWRPRVPMKRW